MVTKNIEEKISPVDLKKQTINTRDNNDNNKADKRNKSRVRPGFVDSLSRVFATIYNALPEDTQSIEDIIIKNNRIIVRYKKQHDPGPENLGLLNNKRVISVDSIETLYLDGGKVMERRDAIYQIKT